MNKKAKEAIWKFGPRPLSRKLNSTDGRVYMWLRGASVPRAQDLQSIVAALGKKSSVSIEDLIAPDEPCDVGDRRKLRKIAATTIQETTA